MNELIEYAQLLMNYLQTSGPSLDVESQQALGSMLQNILQIIQEQGQGGPGLAPQAPTPPIPPGMPSSNVEGFARDEKTGKLYVRFLGKHPNRQGPVYEYSGVPDSMYNLFRQGAVPARSNGQNKWGKWWKGKVPSMGASVNVLLKQGNFQYRRVG